MERLLLLQNWKVINEANLIPNFTRFNIYNGTLGEFKLKSDNKIYKYFGNSDLKRKKGAPAIAGYYLEEEGLKYMVNPATYTMDKLKTFSLPSSSYYTTDAAPSSNVKLIVQVVDVDTIYNRHNSDKTIPAADVKFLWKSYEINYDKDHAYLDAGHDFSPPVGASSTPTQANYIGSAVQFYQNNVKQLFSNNYDNSDNSRKASLKEIISISLSIEKIINKVFDKYYTLPIYATTIALIKNNWEDVTFTNATSFKEFQEYKNYFSNYSDYLYRNSEIIDDTTGAERLKYLYSFTYAIPILDVNVILDYIMILLKEDDEFDETLLNILKAISSQQSTEFLTKILERLPETNDIGVVVWKTLFQSIYQKLFAMYYGKEIWRKIMDEFYLIWLKSDYNPYDILGNVRSNFPSDPFLYTNAPAILDYKSEKIALIFSNTNYDFHFDFQKIKVTEKPYTFDDFEITRGFYDIFQAVTIQNSSENTNNIRFPVVNINGNISAAVPIFYLMFIDDSKHIKNLQTGLEVTFDVALTFTGVGNLAKLRHLRHVTKLGRVALGLEAAIPGQTLIAYELAQGIGGVVELSSSVASMWINHVNNYQAVYCDTSSTQYNQATCEWYTSFDNWMLFLQLKSAAIDIVSSIAIRNGARKLIANPPANFEQAAYDIVAKFAHQDFTELKNLFKIKLTGELGNANSSVLQKLEQLPLSPINRQEEFINEFQNATKQTLTKLNDNTGDLVVHWNEIEFLKGARKEVEFLEAYRTIRNDSNLLEHVHEGHVNVTPNPSGSTKVDLTGLHNQHGLVPPPPNPGQWSFSNPLEVKTNSRGYKRGKVERNMADTIDPATNQPYVHPYPKDPLRPNIKPKKDDSVFWPEYSTDPVKNAQRINEEMAFAFSNKVQLPSKQANTLKFEGKASDGQKISIFKDKYGKWSIFPDQFDGF